MPSLWNLRQAQVQRSIQAKKASATSDGGNMTQSSWSAWSYKIAVHVA
ncbi:hypothetical protein MUK42_11700 [Musa troglodytarum]|uniref:Uncharacterized protein n=1 Tax=Musa troglodytarum TaxID=320322 RepID=A0A9E7KMM3_9LILI|nr:hypothetical protein MUK42_11700 [Musa troglodytarum]